MYGNLVLFPLLCSTAAALQMMGPSTYKARVGSIAHIPCTFTADKLPADPRFFAVLWYLEEKMILSYDDIITSTDPRYSLDKDRALYGIVDLIISNAFVPDGGDYTCSVTYSPLRTEKKIRVDISAIPTITMDNKVVTMSTKSSLNSTISGFYPVDIDIKWFRDGEILANVIMEIPQRDPDGTYSVKSSVTIIPTEEDRERNFSCRVQHKFLTAPLQEDFRLVYSARPLVSILGNSVQRNTENTLTCMVSGFFPSDIDVTWYKDGEVLQNQLMGKPQKYDNGTFQVNSTVTVTPSDDDQSKTFSCRVQHRSLQEPLQEDFQLIYQESSSHSINMGIVGIIIPVVVIIAAVIIGIILWKRKPWRKGGRRSDEEAENQDNENKKLTSGDESGDVRGTRHSINDTKKTSIRNPQPEPQEERNHSQMTGTRSAIHRKPPDTITYTPGDVRQPPDSIHNTNKTSIRNQQHEPREGWNHSQTTGTRSVILPKPSYSVSTPGDPSLENQRSERHQTMPDYRKTKPSANSQDEEMYYSKGRVRNSIAMFENKI